LSLYYARFNRSRETELFAEQKGRTNFEVLHLQEFNPSQIELFLEKHFDGDERKTRNTLGAMHATYNLWDLARRPVLLEMILKVFPRLRKKSAKDLLAPASLYEEYIEEWIVTVAKGNEELLDPSAKRLFCQDLAEWMYENNRDLLPFAELEGLVHQYFKDRPPAAYAALDTEVRTCSFLNRDSVGNYQFVHRSFMEWFVAKAIAGELRKGQLRLFCTRQLTFEIRNFLRGMVDDVDCYWRALRWTRGKPTHKAGASGANSVSMLRLLEIPMQKRNFSSCNLTEADFSYCSLDGASFRAADLSKAVFTNAQLKNTDFAAARMYDVEIHEYRGVTSLEWSTRHLVVGCIDGSLRLYSTATWNAEHMLRGHLSQVQSAVFSFSEQWLFTVSDDRLIAWSCDGFPRFAEFRNRSGEQGPLAVKYVADGYDIRILGERQNVFVPAPLLSRVVEELELSVRSYNCIKNANAQTVLDVVSKTEAEWLRIKNFGRRSINELKEILGVWGLEFGMNIARGAPRSGSKTIEIDVLPNSILVKDVSDGASKRVFEVPIKDKVKAVSFSQAHLALAAGTDDGVTHVWDIRSGKKLAELSQGALDCNGMNLEFAEGLERPVSPWNGPTLGEWLEARGARLSQQQRSAFQAVTDSLRRKNRL
jgi:WD40 repeat protein